eukprot:12910721-Ditylum_brightwellii.AAC.1
MIRYLNRIEKDGNKIGQFSQLESCCTVLKIVKDEDFDIEFDNNNSTGYNSISITDLNVTTTASAKNLPDHSLKPLHCKVRKNIPNRIDLTYKEDF